MHLPCADKPSCKHPRAATICRSRIALAVFALAGLPVTKANAVDAESQGYPKAMGIKLGVIQPVASGRAFLPAGSLAFDVRFGPRDYFLELGAGFALASDSNAQSSRATVEGLWIEIGASVYLSSGSIAPYVGAGISPRLWGIHGGAANDGIKGAVYGQFGVTFTRDSRFRIYSELRVSQNLISLPEYSKILPPPAHAGTYYPTEFALQAGVGW
jgi:hypothetical protein